MAVISSEKPKVANDLTELAEQVGYFGAVRLRVQAPRSTNVRFPGKRWFYPANENEWNKIINELGVPLELPSDREDGRFRSVPIYSVSALVGDDIVGRDLLCAIRPNKAGTAIAAFPLEYKYLGEDIWQTKTVPTTFDIVFTKRSSDSGWTATHPITGQRMVAMKPRDNDWTIETVNSKTSRVYKAGELAIRRTVTSTVLIVGPFELLETLSTKAIAKLGGEEWDEKTDSDDVKESKRAGREKNRLEAAEKYRLFYLLQEPVFHLGILHVSATRLVGNFLEWTDAEGQALIKTVATFRKNLFKELHPDIMGNPEIAAITDEEEKDRAILVAHEDRFQTIKEELDRLIKWLQDRYEYNKLNRELYAATGSTPPVLKVNPPVFPKGYRQPKQLAEDSRPLAYWDTKVLAKLLFTAPKVVKEKSATRRTSTNKPAAESGASAPAQAQKPKATRQTKPEEPATPDRVGKFNKNRSRAAAGGATPHVDQETRTARTSGGEVRNSLGDALRAKGVKPEDFAKKGVEPGKRLGASFRFVRCDACDGTHKMPADYNGGNLTECPPKRRKK